MKLDNYEVFIPEGTEKNGVVTLRDGATYSLHFQNNAPEEVKVGFSINGKHCGFYKLPAGFDGALNRAQGSDEPFVFTRGTGGLVAIEFYKNNSLVNSTALRLVEFREQPAITAASAPIAPRHAYTPPPALPTPTPPAPPAPSATAPTAPTPPPRNSASAAPAAPAASTVADILVAHGDAELGPISEAEILSKIRAGELSRTDTYWRDGMGDWEPLNDAAFVKSAKGLPPPRNSAPPRRSSANTDVGNALATAGDAFKKTWQISNMFGLMIEGLLRWIARVLAPSRVNAILGFMRKLGQYGILISTVIVIFSSVALAIVTNRTAWLLLPIPTIILAAFGQFIAGRFLDANEKIVSATRNRLSSTIVLECVALLSLLAALCAIPTVIGTFFFLLIAAIALNPTLVNIEQQENASVSEEAISLWMFFQKLSLKMTPFIFALCTVLSALCCIAGTLMLCVGGNSSSSENIFDKSGLLDGGIGLLFVACLLPATSYFGFLFWGFFSDFIQSIVVISPKLDKLNETLNKKETPAAPI